MSRRESRLLAFAAKVRGFLRGRRYDGEFDDEIQGHLQTLAEKFVAQGMSRKEAAAAARRQFGNTTLLREDHRKLQTFLSIEALWQDLRYAIRMLRKSPGFTTVAVLTLALGIGANTAIFSVVQGVVLAPLPYREPDRLVMVWLNNVNLKSITSLSYADFLDWQRDARSFEKIGAYAWRDFDLSSPGTPEHLQGREMSAEFLATLGVEPALGRGFSAEEDRNGGAPV